MTSELPIPKAIQRCLWYTSYEGYEEVVMEAKAELQALLDDLDKWRTAAETRHHTLNMMSLQSKMMSAEIQRLRNRLETSGDEDIVEKAYFSRLSRAFGDTK
jgi:predicted  nucleic acid-binding Zn-ribbon protein